MLYRNTQDLFSNFLHFVEYFRGMNNRGFQNRRQVPTRAWSCGSTFLLALINVPDDAHDTHDADNDDRL